MTTRAKGGIPDLVSDDLLVLFCGINPGLLSGELGQHFARPGNRFWKLLHAGGFTDRVFLPSEQHLLPEVGIGITNLVARPTRAASELTRDELIAGGRLLADKVHTVRPRALAVLGMQAFRVAFERPHAAVGMQDEPLGETPVWLLPNPSGLQANYQMPEMTALFRSLHNAVSSQER